MLSCCHVVWRMAQCRCRFLCVAACRCMHWRWLADARRTSLREPWAAVRSAVVCRNRAPCDPFPLRSPGVLRSTKTNHPLAMGRRFGHGAWSSGDASCPSSSAHRGCTGYSAAPKPGLRKCASTHRKWPKGKRRCTAQYCLLCPCALFAPPTSAPGTGVAPAPGLGLAPAASACGTGARRCHICTRTGLAPAHICTEIGLAIARPWYDQVPGNMMLFAFVPPPLRQQLARSLAAQRIVGLSSPHPVWCHHCPSLLAALLHGKAWYAPQPQRRYLGCYVVLLPRSLDSRPRRSPCRRPSSTSEAPSLYAAVAGSPVLHYW